MSSSGFFIPSLDTEELHCTRRPPSLQYHPQGEGAWSEIFVFHSHSGNTGASRDSITGCLARPVSLLKLVVSSTRKHMDPIGKGFEDLFSALYATPPTYHEE